MEDSDFFTKPLEDLGVKGLPEGKVTLETMLSQPRPIYGNYRTPVGNIYLPPNPQSEAGVSTKRICHPIGGTALGGLSPRFPAY